MIYDNDLFDQVCIGEFRLSTATVQKKIRFYTLLKKYPILFHGGCSYTEISDNITFILTQIKKDKSIQTLFESASTRIEITTNKNIVIQDKTFNPLIEIDQKEVKNVDCLVDSFSEMEIIEELNRLVNE